MAGLIDLTGLESLQQYSVRIQDLNEKTSLNPSDVFVVDKVNYNSYSTNTIKYDYLSANILDEIENCPTVDVNGHWNFSKNNVVLVDTYQAIERLKQTEPSSSLSSKIMVNLDYLNNSILKAIYDLSVELYSHESPHVPSYVGQIITSNTLSTLALVKNVYGDYTNWLKLNQVMICGAGSPEPNNYTKFGNLSGGEYDLSVGQENTGELHVTLDKDQIPSHSHKFKAKTSKFTITWYLSWINEVIDHPTTTGVQFYNAKNMTHHKHRGEDGEKVGLWQVKKASSAALHATFTGEGSISTEDFKKTSLLDVIYDPNEKAGGSPVTYGQSHNNMPPFVTEYVWKRIK